MPAPLIIQSISGALGGALKIFGAREQRKTQEAINEGEYIRFLSKKEIDRQRQQTYLIIAGFVLIVILAILIFKKGGPS